MMLWPTGPWNSERVIELMKGTFTHRRLHLDFDCQLGPFPLEGASTLCLLFTLGPLMSVIVQVLDPWLELKPVDGLIPTARDRSQLPVHASGWPGQRWERCALHLDSSQGKPCTRHKVFDVNFLCFPLCHVNEVVVDITGLRSAWS